MHFPMSLQLLFLLLVSLSSPTSVSAHDWALIWGLLLLAHNLCEKLGLLFYLLYLWLLTLFLLCNFSLVLGIEIHEILIIYISLFYLHGGAFWIGGLKDFLNTSDIRTLPNMMNAWSRHFLSICLRLSLLAELQHILRRLILKKSVWSCIWFLLPISYNILLHLLLLFILANLLWRLFSILSCTNNLINRVLITIH